MKAFSKNGIHLIVGKNLSQKFPRLIIGFDRERKKYDVGYFKNEETANWFCDIMDEFLKKDKEKWISVKERLPEYERKVLAFVKNKNPEGRYNKDGIYVAHLEDKIPQPDPQGKRNFLGLPGYDSEWTVWSWSYFSEPEVTHWMPLPDPPEAKEDPDQLKKEGI